MLSLTALLLIPLPVQVQAPADGGRQIRIELESRKALLELAPLDLDMISVAPNGREARVVAYADDLDRLDALGVPYSVEIEDLQSFYADRIAADPGPQVGATTLGQWLTPAFGSGSMGGYYTYSEMVSVINQIQAAYPSLVSVPQSLGTTLQGRDLWAFRVSDNPGVSEGEPEVRMDAMHHAREPMSMHALIWYVLFLTEEYATDPLAAYLVDEREQWFVPVVNPDGYVYNETIAPGGGGLWRKNRRNNGGGIFGVDLNRNYDFQWGYDNIGSSGSANSETYRGPAAASEREVAAMQTFMAAHSFVTVLTVHCHGNLWLRPYGYDVFDPANVADYIEVGDLAVEFNQYAHVPGTVLYPANGVTDDYDEGVHGSMAWTPEIGNDTDGFWPATSRIIPLAMENQMAFARTALAAGAYMRASDVQTSDPAGDGDGFFEPGETIDVVVTARNSGWGTPGTNVIGRVTTTSPDAAASAPTFDFGAVTGFSDTTNAATPFTLTILGNPAPGTVIPFQVELDYEGTTVIGDFQVITGERFAFAIDNVEADHGWSVGDTGDTATTGIWTRADPTGTTFSGEDLNPEDDHTAGASSMCFVTGNGRGAAGNDDVDGGATTLFSPPFDLSGATVAYVSYWRWWADLSFVDDVFVAEISNDAGQNWTTLETETVSDSAWTHHEFRVNDFLTPTADMLLRFIASDTGTGSLVEAAVDDVVVEIYDDRPRFNVYGSEEQGTSLTLNLSGQQGDFFLHYFSTGTGNIPITNVTGNFLLDPANYYLLFKGFVPASRLAVRTATVPTDPFWTNLDLYLQSLVFGSSETFLTNSVHIVPF